MYYFTLLALHILFAGIWLVSFIADPILKKTISLNKNKAGERKFIHLYLTMANLLGMIGSIGILFTGIVLVDMTDRSYFQMTANHWLSTKQIIMVVILILIGAVVIPTAKKLRNAIGEDLESNSSISEEGYKNLWKLYKVNFAISIMVLINFLLALSHRFIG